MIYNKKHANKVNQMNNGNIYIGSYFKGDILSNGEIARALHVRLKCPYCGKERDVRIDAIIHKCRFCCNEYENSFAYHIEHELNLNLCDVWDFDKNIVNPYFIYKTSNQKVWIKCVNKDVNPYNKLLKSEYHDSYDVRCGDYIHGDRCPYCSLKGNKVHEFDSFMYWAINSIDKDFEFKYISNENTLDLWRVAIQSKQKAIFKCQEKDYHDDYKSSCLDFYRKYKDGTVSICPQCFHKSGKFHPLDSFGALYPDKAKYWDYEKNDKTPFEVVSFTHKKYWFICCECGKSFKRSMSKVNRTDYRQDIKCADCNVSSKLEIKTMEVLDKYHIRYESQKKFSDLKGVKNGLLSYDFLLCDYDILLENQGEQHEHYVQGLQASYDDFLKQQEHDKRKFNYAIKHNYIPMEIWYWDIDNIEDILIRELELN